MKHEEYDRFGPWILEVSEKDPLPPLFVPYIGKQEEPLICVKIPRQIERRRASPKMHLYDYVICLYPAHFLILKRTGEEVQTHSFGYNELEGIRHTENLLHGKATFFIAEASYTIPYNTVSDNLVKKIIDIIREKYTGKSRSEINGGAPPESVHRLGQLFQNLFAGEKQLNPRNRLLAVQTETPIHTTGNRRLHQLFHRVSDKILLETLHFCDGRELKIIGRPQTYRYRSHPVYGLETTYIPIDRLKAVYTEEAADTPGIVFMNLETTRARHRFTFLRDNPGVAQYLEMHSLQPV